MSLEIANIEKHFGRFPALKGVSLFAEDGEFLALLGPSGSGKTTLLRIIAGLEAPDGGHVAFRGEDLLAKPVRQRGIGFVFQHYALFKHMTVAQNIAFGMRAKPKNERPSNAQIKAKVAELLAMVQLEGLGGRYPAQLSGGQRQRVALARARRSSRKSCCWTNRLARSMPKSVANSVAGCAICTSAPASPPSSSRTTRKKRSNSPIASPC